MTWHPYAFRRFVTWLRAAILRGGLDRKHAFPADNFDPDAGTITLALSDWLLFGLPD